MNSDSLSSITLASSYSAWGYSPIQSTTWQVEVTSGSPGSHHTIILLLCNTEQAQFVDVSEVVLI